MHTEKQVEKMLADGLNGLQVAKELKKDGYSAAETKSFLLGAGVTVEEENAGWGIVLHIECPVSHPNGALLGPLSGSVRELAWPNKRSA